MPKEKNFLRIDLLILIIILFIGLKYTFRLEDGLDIRFFDESAYMFNGVKLASEGLPRPDFAPIYAIWYFILSLIEPNRVSLYYLNYKLMTILPPLLVYVLLRKNQVTIHVSALISWFFLISSVNAGTWPKVSHFALILILGILILASRKSLLWTSLYVSFGALLVAYVRPEFFISFLLSMLIFIIVFTLNKNETFQLTYLMGFALLSVLLLIVIGIPYSGNRSFVAFGQHFSSNWVIWNENEINPWTNWQEILSQNFGSGDSILDAFIHNPSMFLKHITYNITSLIKNAPDVVLPDIFPKDLLSIIFAALSIIGLCIVNLKNIPKKFKEFSNLFIFFGIFIIPSLISIIIIHPRDHYLLIVFVLSALFLTILLDKHKLDQRQLDYQWIMLLGFFAFTITPYYANPGEMNLPQPKKDAVNFIQTLNIIERVNLLETEGGYHYFLGDNYHRISQSAKDIGFFGFLEEQGINMIVLTDGLLEDTRFRDDPEWQEFLTIYPDFGFIGMDITQTDKMLLIHTDLLY